MNKARFCVHFALPPAVLLAALAAHAEVTLYEHDDYRGRSFRAGGDITDLSREGFNDKASSAEVHGGSWEVCNDANFGGRCVRLDPGSYRSLSDMGLNDRISSLRRLRGGGHQGGGHHETTLFEHDDFRGRTFAARGSVPNLNSEGFNDRASSVEIRGGSWELCDDANFRGRCVTLDPGSYESLGDMGLNDRISSIRPASGYGSGHSSSSSSGRPGNHGGSAIPQVTENRNGSFRVAFSNNACMAFYNPQGHRTSALNQCDRDQIRRADDAVRSYRREQGADHSAPGHSSGGGETPEIIMGRNREGEVIFSNNCVVYYDAAGRRTKSLPACNRGQINRADNAMRSYRREQGL